MQNEPKTTKAKQNKTRTNDKTTTNGHIGKENPQNKKAQQKTKTNPTIASIYSIYICRYYIGPILI